MVSINVSESYQKNKELVYDYHNEITGEFIEQLIKKEILHLIKRDILKGFVVSYPSKDFDIDDFM